MTIDKKFNEGDTMTKSPEEMEELFDPKHETWQKLYKKHKKADEIGRTAANLEVGEVKKDNVEIELAKFIHKYHIQVEYGDKAPDIEWKDLDEDIKLTYKGRASQALSDLAESQGVTTDSLKQKVENEGLLSLINSYSNNELQSRKSNLGRGLIVEHVKPETHEAWADHLMENNKALVGERKKHAVQANAPNYALQHLMQYHNRHTE